jgi:molybdopterin adenylyltransferase
MFSTAVITVSDRCHRGERIDEGGPLVAEILKNAGYAVTLSLIVPDEQELIESTLKKIADDGVVNLIVTTGGTGFAPRDVTPEATLAVCEKLTPGIPEAMRYASLKVTSRAMLSRAQAGIRKDTLIINLPGSPKAAKENLEAVLSALDHGLTMLQGEPADCAKLSN